MTAKQTLCLYTKDKGIERYARAFKLMCCSGYVSNLRVDNEISPLM